MTQTTFYVQRKSSGLIHYGEPKPGVTLKVTVKVKRFKYAGEVEQERWAYFYDSEGQKVWDCNDGYLAAHFREVPAPDWAKKKRRGGPRGTTNRNDRGNTKDREARRWFLMNTYAADKLGYCRCYRCGKLLLLDQITVDRIVPGNHGGTYRRNNIRPACAKCNSATGVKAKS